MVGANRLYWIANDKRTGFASDATPSSIVDTIILIFIAIPVVLSLALSSSLSGLVFPSEPLVTTLASPFLGVGLFPFAQRYLLLREDKRLARC